MLEDRGRADAVPGAEGDLEYEPVTALIPYLRAIRLHWRLIAATALVAMVSCAVFLQFLSPDYEAQAQVLVTPLTPDDQSFVGLPVVRTAPGDPTRTVTTVAGVIESPEVAERAAQGLDDEVDAAQIEDAVTVAPEEGSNVIDITANADDPELAAAIASAYAEAALKVRQEILRPLVGAAIKRGETQLESIADQQGTAAEAIRTRVSELSALQDRSDPTLSVAQLATVPSSPLDKPAWLLLAVAAVAGALLGIGALALGRSLTERLIEDEDGLLRTLPLKIYARVPVGKRRADEDADRRGPPDRSAYHLLRVQLEAREIQLRGRDAPQIGPSGVVAIVGLSPGAATRNTALGLGSAIGQAGGEAIVVDGAPHLGGSAAQFGSEPQPDDRDLVATPTFDLDPIPGEPGLRVATGPGPDDAGPSLRGLVERATDQADCVLVDAGPVSGITDALPLVAAADHVVLVVHLGRSRASDLLLAAELLSEEIAAHRVGYLVLESQ